MYTRRFFPRSLSPEQLDRFLAHGWYRMGQSVFTCRFVIFGDTLKSTVWTRLPLAGYSFRRSLRKLVRRNSRRFRTAIGPASIGTANEELYQRYRDEFDGELAPSVHAALNEESIDGDLFETHEVAVYDGDRLIGFSLFDRGSDSLASILGVYDPDYARHSIGFYTMLVEIEHGRACGYRYFYPGYVVPGYPALDYKLRIGEVETYDFGAQTWRPLATVAERSLPAESLQRRLAEMADALAERDIDGRLLLYPPYELRALGGDFSDCLPVPLFLALGSDAAKELPVIAYDVDRAEYLLLHCVREGDVREHFESFVDLESSGGCCLDILRIDQAVVRSERPTGIVSILGHLTGPGR